MKLFIASLVIILFGFVIIRFESPGDRQQLSELAVVLLITLLAVSVISWLASGFLIRRIRADLPIKKEKIIFLSKYSISSTSLLFFTPILIEVLTNTFYPIMLSSRYNHFRIKNIREQCHFVSQKTKPRI